MLIHQETLSLRASPDEVRRFVTTPERIMDYYPNGTGCGVIEPGESFYCQGKAGVSLMERLADESDDTKVVLKVTTARGLRPPFSAEQIRQNAFFIMIEDWEIYPDGEGGTRLVKSWRDIEKLKLRWLPLAFIVRQSAKAESSHLKTHWDLQAGR